MLCKTATSLPRSSVGFVAAPLLHPPSHRRPSPLEQTTARRSLAARASKDDKSWQELLSDAAEVAKAAASKVVSSIQNAASSVLAPAKPQPPPPQQLRREREREELQNLGINERDLPALGGFFGKAIGGMIGAMVGQLGKELAKSADERDAVMRDATFEIKGNAKLKARMGEVVVSAAPMSQSISSASINGQVTKRVSLVIPVVGAKGSTAYARVESSQGPRGVGSLKISVQMPEGDILQLDGTGGDGGGKGQGTAGRTIDVDFEEIRK